MSIKVDLKGRVAIVTGGSRGIGRETCLALARNGCNVVVAAKSITAKPNLPGTIFTVADEVRALGVKALAVQLNVMHEDSVVNCINKTVEAFGRIDILVNNASSLWWHSIEKTPMKKYDLIHAINARGTFCMTKYAVPHMKKNKWGRVINMSPPITTRGFKGRTAYNHSKMGMTMVALGVAEEYRGQGITANALWPATVIESQASINFKLGDPKYWRKADILADCVLGMCKDDEYTGNATIDDDYLRERHGFEDKDFLQYRYNPAFKPVRALAAIHDEIGVQRGNVSTLRKDMQDDLGEMKHRAKL